MARESGGQIVDCIGTASAVNNESVFVSAPL